MQPFSFVYKLLLLAVLMGSGLASAADKVDINSADAAQLEQVLVGVGPAKAEAIVEHRKANGPFKSADELALVKGIGLSAAGGGHGAPAGKPAKATPGAPAAATGKPVARR